MRDTATPHTPGPWRAVKFKDTKSWSLYANAGSLGNIRDEVDARLAAAAPVMLEALVKTRDNLSGLSQSDDDVFAAMIRRIDVAIAKTTGAK